MTEQFCKKLHSINFISIKNEDTFDHEVILIRGYIDNVCSLNTITIKVNNQEKVEIIEFGKFKFLVKLLKNHDNFVEINYCTGSSVLKLFYSDENVYNSLDVVPLYIINSGHDGSFQTTKDDPENSAETACNRINLSLKLIQSIISEKLLEAGFPRKTFASKACEIFNSEFNVEQIRSSKDNEIYDLIAQEILEKKGEEACSTTKFVGFLSCTQFEGIFDDNRSYSNMNSKTKGNPALGGGFLCLVGTGFLFSWPNKLEDVIPALKNETIVDVTQVRDDSNYRHTYAGCYSTTLGSLCHELCHTFDLGHTFTGIMGKDFDFVGRFFLTKILTENIPDRQVKKHTSFKSRTENVNCQKLTKIRKPGQQFLEKYHQQKDNDMTFFEKNCCIILFYHKWFNQFTSNSKIEYQTENKTINSSNSCLRLVELRENENSIVIKYWSFLKTNVTVFKIPTESLLENVTLFAINDFGDILKEKLH